MAEPVYDFIGQSTLDDGTHKNPFFLHVQAACFRKGFKEKTQEILKWGHQHILPQHNPVLLNSVMKKWKNKYPVCTVSVPAVYANKI